MNKKVNTVIFIIVGTLVNIIITLAMMAVMMVLSAMIFKNHPEVFSIISMVIVMGTLLASMVLYQKLSLWVVEKLHLEDKLEPLWGSRNKKKTSDQ